MNGLIDPPVIDLVEHHLLLTGLIDLRKRGILYGVWCDDFRIRVKFTMYDDFHHLGRIQAWDLVKLHTKKPPQSVIITPDRVEESA